MLKHLIGLALLLATTYAFAWPEWDMQKLKFDDYIVGLGVADSRANARTLALAEIASQLSVSVSVKETQSSFKHGTIVDTKFNQSIQTSSLPFKLVGVEVLKTASKENKTAILLGVKKSTLVNTLNESISDLTSLAIPDTSAEYKFIHVIESTPELHRKSQMLQVLEFLEGNKLSFRADLNKLRQEHLQVLNDISCQIIANSTPKSIVTAIDNKLTCNGKTRLWIKPQLNWRLSTYEQVKHAQANLNIKFTRTINPFNTIKEYNIVAVASSKSIDIAKEEAVTQLVIKLNQPIHQWNSEQ